MERDQPVRRVRHLETQDMVLCTRLMGDDIETDVGAALLSLSLSFPS